MIELRWVTVSGHDKNGEYLPETKQLQYRVKVEVSGAWAGMVRPDNVQVHYTWTKWRPVPDIGWDWNHTDTETI